MSIQTEQNCFDEELRRCVFAFDNFESAASNAFTRPQPTAIVRYSETISKYKNDPFYTPSHSLPHFIEYPRILMQREHRGQRLFTG